MEYGSCILSQEVNNSDLNLA